MTQFMSAFGRSRVIPLCLIFLTVACLLLSTLPVLAATDETVDQALPETSYPGLEDFTPRITALATKAIDADQQITKAEKALELAPQVAELQVTLSALETDFTDWEQLSDWPLSSLMEARSRYTELKRQQKALQQKFSEPLKILEELHQFWSTEKTFWEGWGAALRETWQQTSKSARIKAPRESLERNLATIQAIIERIAQVTNKLILLQQTFSVQQELVAGRIQRVDGAIDELRRDTFRRNAHSVFSPEFYVQFSSELITGVKTNIETTLRVPVGFLKTQGWVTILQIVAGLIIGTMIKVRRKQPKPITRELRFLFDHPWAGAIFLSISLFSWLNNNPPAFWRWGIMVTGLSAATFLIVAMYQHPVVRRLIRLIALMFVLSETMQLVGLPRPLQQLFLIFLCVAIILIALVLVRREGKEEEASRSGLTMFLNLGAVVGLIGLLAGVAGFATFTANMLEAFIGTIMVALGANMAIRLTDGGIHAFMKKEWIRDQRFVQRLGIQTTARLQSIMHIILYTNAFVYLFVVWNIYETPQRAWTSLMALEYTIGDFSLSVQMVALLALVLYLTSLFSWFLQAFVDAQILTPKGMAFGARSAIKRLVHYALFTLGFFIAVSMAGIGLEKFAIIAGALGVGIGFGLQNIVNNFISGLILLFERPIKIGDTISLDDQWGTVTKIGLRSTVVETLDRAEVIVPNADLIAQKVTNWTLTSNVTRLIIPVGVAYGSNLTSVLSILDKVGSEHPEVLKEPAPSAIFTQFGESSIDFELRVWVDDISKRLAVKSELGQAIDTLFREAGISIPFPQRDLHLRSIESNLQELFDRSSERAAPNQAEDSP